MQTLNRPTRIFLLVCMAILLTAACAHAVPPQLRFEQMSIEEGLPQQSVHSVLQDRQGFMWFATHGGLVRFDGYRMTVFRHEREEAHSLSSNRLWKIFEDREGTLWVATAEGGLNRFEAGSESFKAYRHDPADPHSLADDRVWDVFEDERGRLWVATSSGLSLFDPAADTFTNKMLGKEIRSIVQAMAPESSNPIWVGTSRHGLVRFDPATGPVESFRNDPSDVDSLPNDQVLVLSRDGAGALWVGTAGGLALFDEAAGSFQVFRHHPDEPHSLAGPKVQSIFEDRAGNLWIGTNRGLSLLDRESGRFDNFRHDPSARRSLPHRSVASVYQDRTGILWVGTLYGGVARVDPRIWQFTEYSRGGDPLRSPPGGVVALSEDREGLLWVGTSEGLVHFDSDPKSFSAPQAWGAPVSGAAGIASDKAGDVWVASRWGTLERWDSSAGRSQEVSLHANTSRHEYITALYSDASGALWIGQQGLVKLEPGPKLTRYSHRPGDATSPAPSGIKTLAPGSEAALWIGYSDRGLARLAADSEQFEHFRLYAGAEGQPSVSAIYEDEAGRVWVGTNAGLFRMVLTGNQPEVRTFTVRHGLASDLIAGILPDDLGRLWLSTSAGLSCFEPATETVRNFGTADGALPGGYNKGAALRLRDGRMVFGGPGGMTVFHPEKIHQDPTLPPLVFTDLRLRNQSVPLDPSGSGLLVRPIHLTTEIVLGPEDDLVSFEFAALHFAHPPNNRYAYKLEGFDGDWTFTDASRRVATYTDLQPGSYTLRVRGSNLDGIWNDEGIALGVEVLPPWWRTWWAYMLYFLAFGGLIFSLVLANRRLEAVVAARTAQVRSQARRIQEENDAKARFIANVSHEFRTPLTLAIGPLEDLRQDEGSQLSSSGRQNLEMALRNSQRMVGLVGQVLDIGRLEKGRLRLRLTEFDFAEIVRREAASFSIEAQRSGVTLVAELPEKSVPLVFDVDAMFKVVSNLLSNALKFTQKGGSLRVQLAEKEREVVLAVTDTGHGIAEDVLPRVFERYFQGSQTLATQPGMGIGLALVKELVELHGGQVEAVSRLGKGSTFTVTLRKGREHLHSDDLDREEVGTGEFAVANLFVPGAVPESKDDERTTVLLVEDNPELRHFLAVRLSASYRVLQAEHGEQALETARGELPDLIVSDVTMPVMDGFTMLRELRKDPEISFIPVLLLTARATTHEAIEGLGSGADDYLTKPFDAAELAARIAGILASRRRMSEHLRWKLENEPQTGGTFPETFEQKVQRAIVENLHDNTFTVQDLASALALDRTALFRKMRQGFGKSPSELIRQIRLERAAELLRAREGNVTEICYAVGFPSLSYFGKRFRERYGVAPSRFGQGSGVEPEVWAG